MNSKPTILVSENKTVFQTPFLEQKWAQYFNVEILDTNKNYDRRSTVVVSDWIDVNQSSNSNECVLANKGIRHVIDHCWDSWDSSLDNSADFIIRPRDFIRINESLCYKSLGYDQCELKSNPTKDFLLLMNLVHPHRDNLLDSLKEYVKHNIYSYVARGIPLQNAQDIEFNSNTWQRYTDPHWYTSTRVSVVSESMIYNLGEPTEKNDNRYDDDINVSEKTYKPMAFKHAFVVHGQPGTLVRCKQLGFETFDHVIDESYDSVTDHRKRLELIVNQIKYLIADKSLLTDPISTQKIEHNFEHFYNEGIVTNLFVTQIVNPLLEFIES